MTTGPIEIKFMQAEKGDCFLISYLDNFSTARNILIDGGMTATYYKTSRNFFGPLKHHIDAIVNRNEKIDLLVLSHIDNDHILGLLKWFEMDKSAHEKIGKVWFNSGKLIAQYLKESVNPDLDIQLDLSNNNHTGVNEAVAFEEYLLEKKVWDKRIIKSDMDIKIHDAHFQILSPNSKQLEKLLKEYHRKTDDSVYTSLRVKDWGHHLKYLINNIDSPQFKFKQDTSVNNGSSIGFILTIKDQAFLFLGDAHPIGIVDQLKKRGYSKENPLKLNFIKLSHHGSHRNTDESLLEIIKTNKYIVSTDSSTYGHPDKLTLARIIKNNPNAQFYFNYGHVKSRIFSDQDFVDYKKFSAYVSQVFNC